MKHENLKQTQIPSPIGKLFLVASEIGLRGIYWEKQTSPMLKQNESHKILDLAVSELKEYFAGKRKKFQVPLELIGTKFQKEVWMALRAVPYGKTLSYKDIAQKIKNPKAMRAVGSANGKNPLCIIIPCHRIISSDGSLGGYSGGLHIKTKLLNLENTL